VNGFPGKAAIASTDMTLPWATDLARKDDLIATAPFSQPVSDDDLGMAIGCSANVHWVHLCRIEEIDTTCTGMIHLREAFLWRILFAPGHGTQAYYRYLNASVS
jgi:hypothetical protein